MYYRKHSCVELTLTRLFAIRKGSITTQDCVGERMCVCTCMTWKETQKKKFHGMKSVQQQQRRVMWDGCMIWRLYLVYAIADDDDDDGWQQHYTT